LIIGALAMFIGLMLNVLPSIIKRTRLQEQELQEQESETINL